MAVWTCKTCDSKPLRPHGVARHRSMHWDRGDREVVMTREVFPIREIITYSRPKSREPK